MFKRTFMLTPEEKVKVGEMHGKILQWILEGRSIIYMSEKLHLSTSEIEHNIDEDLYTLMKHVGKWRFFKTLFWK